ncbi:MAG TPA: hypothetical protein VF138_05125 [Caulobacteraceae bacterium]
MRALIPALILVLAPSMAAAQHTSGAGTPMGDLQDLNRFATRGFMNQWSATRPARLSTLSEDAQAWLSVTTERQILAAPALPQVRAELEEALADDLQKVADEQRMKPKDVSAALLLKIMKDARFWIGLDTREDRKKGGEAAQVAMTRLKEADANVKAAMKLQTHASLALAMD